MITCYDSGDVADFRSRWIRIRYSQSFRGQPVRPLLRLAGRTPVEYLLPAAALGRGRWIGRAPADLTRIELSASVDDPSELRVDELCRLTDLQVGWRIARDRPSHLPGFLAGLVGGPRRRTIQAQTALDLASPDDARSYVEARRRPLEPDGLDARLMAAPEGRPSLGFVVPVERGTEDDLRSTLRSLARQADRAFGIWLVCARASAPAVAASVQACDLAGMADIVELPPGESPERAALRVASELDRDWVGLLRPGDRLTQEAVLVLREHVAGATAPVVYTDDGTADAEGAFGTLRLKPDWSPAFLRQVDYVGRLCLFRRDALKAARQGLVRSDPHPWWSALQAAGARGGRDRVAHLKRVLIARPGNEDPPRRPHVPAAPPRSAGRATILIPTRDRAELLRRAVGSLFDRTPPGLFDLVVIDNDTSAPDALAYLADLEARPGVAVLRRPGPFNFSTLINDGAASAGGDVLVLLNNDCEILDGSWLAAMTTLAAEADVGAVGAKLLYGDATLQHAGVGIGLGGEAGHRDRASPRDHPGHLGRLTAVHEISAVTGACLAVQKRKFDEAGGFDPAFAVAFNDIDFCLRLQARGYRNLFTPFATLIHAESATRGLETGPRRIRFLEEAARFRTRWRREILDDPFLPPLLASLRLDDRVG